MIDSAGRVGSVDHRIEARDVTLGSMKATGPVLVRVPSGPEGEARLALDGARQDERLALEIDLEADKSRIESTGVEFEIAATADGPALLHSSAVLSPGPREGSILAQGVASMRALPPGPYILRAKVTSGKEGIGEVRRAFAVTEAPRTVAGTVGAAPTVVGRPSGVRPVARLPISAAPPFALDQVLAPPVLGVFLDRVAERPDAAAAPVRELLDRARTKGPGGLVVADAEAAAAPGAFLKGLSLLADRKLEPAAAAFRDAMRVSADFYPAMIYLGACYAAGGRDKEAAAVWRTALIREGKRLRCTSCSGTRSCGTAGETSPSTIFASHTSSGRTTWR